VNPRMLAEAVPEGTAGGQGVNERSGERRELY